VERAGNQDVLDKHPALAPKGRAFLDSGAFSFLVNGYNKKIPRQEIEKQVPAYLKRYAEWVKGKSKRFDFYVTFDYVVEAPVVYQATKALQQLGIRPVPIYHGDSDLDWVRKYIDEGHKIIGVSKRFFLNDRKGLLKYFDHVFKLTEQNKIFVHGFACTGSEAWRYPFGSIDSTTLVKKAGNGIIHYFDHRGISHELSVTQGTSFSKDLLGILETRKVTLETLKTQRYARVLFNAVSLQEFLSKRKPLEWNHKTLF